MPMVQYWKTKDAVSAKVTTNKDGALVMMLEGEKEVFPGFPRGHSLFGTLSKLKHEIKNQIFNESWAKLEAGVSHETVIRDIKGKVVGGLQEYLELVRYDMIPPEKMVKPVREIWRALSVLERDEPRLRWLKEVLTFIMQEDDAYRFRVQWLISIFRPRWYKNPVKDLQIALEELEVGEVIGDMKERIRLLRRIVMLILEDKQVLDLFYKFCTEVDWDKVKLSRADKYHFRGKYFKCDLMYFEY